MSDILPVSAEVLAQDTHIVQSPSPRRDVAPSTSADTKIHVGSRDHGIDEDEDDEDVRSVSSSIVEYRRARKQLPPLPDLRFEQSYLASIAPAQGVWWKIALITLKDQVMFPLLQGVGYNLLVAAWRVWNRGAKFSGAGVGGEFV